MDFWALSPFIPLCCIWTCMSSSSPKTNKKTSLRVYKKRNNKLLVQYQHELEILQIIPASNHQMNIVGALEWEKKKNLTKSQILIS